MTHHIWILLFNYGYPVGSGLYLFNCTSYGAMSITSGSCYLAIVIRSDPDSTYLTVGTSYGAMTHHIWSLLS
jgi:hypothetical protein